MKNKIVVILYAHPESYPPVLNLLGELSKVGREVLLQFRPVFPIEWKYPANLRLLPSGKAMPVREQEKLPIHKKILLFLTYTWDLLRLVRKEKPEVLVAVDPLASLVMYLVRGFLGYKPLLWYHNQDVSDMTLLNKYSLGGFAAMAEPRLFPYLDMFSLPANERAEYFPMDKLKGRYFFIPNYTSLHIYGNVYKPDKNLDKIKVYFMGHVGPGHAIEEIINMMPLRIQGKPIHLVLKGFIRQENREKYEKLIREKKAEEYVEMIGYTAYQEVPELTASCHIGVAVFTKNDIMNNTLGTASGKVYEYFAAGLPIIYYGNPHFRKHLGKYEWAFATDLSESSLLDCMEKIVANYRDLSARAHEAFLRELNYEHQFREMAEFLSK